VFVIAGSDYLISIWKKLIKNEEEKDESGQI
jgi:hypothetical protein